MIRRIGLAPIAVATTLVLVGISAGCEDPADAVIAREIHGEWSVSDEASADRAFVIKRDSLYLHQAGGIVIGHRIKKISRSERRDHVAYTIRYVGIVQDHDLRFEYYPGPARYIAIRNSPRVIWRPAGAQTARESSSP